MNTMTIRSMFVALACVFYGSFASAISVGQVDNFNAGVNPEDTSGWIVNAGPLGTVPPAVPPTNIATGGPAGVGDRYLQLTSTGIDAPQSPGSRMTAFNVFGQWSGDYTAAGVRRITMDVNNFGPNPLHLRLLLGDLNSTFDGFDHFSVSTNAAVLAPGSGWQNVAFDVTESDLTSNFGNTVDALASVEVLRIFHNPAAVFPGPPGGIPVIEGVLGIDNITAVPVPPALVLFGSALLGLWRRRRTA